MHNYLNRLGNCLIFPEAAILLVSPRDLESSGDEIVCRTASWAPDHSFPHAFVSSFDWLRCLQFAVNLYELISHVSIKVGSFKYLLAVSISPFFFFLFSEDLWLLRRKQRQRFPSQCHEDGGLQLWLALLQISYLASVEILPSMPNAKAATASSLKHSWKIHRALCFLCVFFLQGLNVFACVLQIFCFPFFSLLKGELAYGGVVGRWQTIFLWIKRGNMQGSSWYLYNHFYRISILMLTFFLISFVFWLEFLAICLIGL